MTSLGQRMNRNLEIRVYELELKIINKILSSRTNIFSFNIMSWKKINWDSSGSTVCSVQAGISPLDQSSRLEEKYVRRKRIHSGRNQWRYREFDTEFCPSTYFLPMIWWTPQKKLFFIYIHSSIEWIEWIEWFFFQIIHHFFQGSHALELTEEIFKDLPDKKELESTKERLRRRYEL